MSIFQHVLGTQMKACQGRGNAVNKTDRKSARQ